MAKTSIDEWKRWSNRIQANIQWREQKFHDKWKRWIRAYRGDHWTNYISQGWEQVSAENPRTYITVNEIGSIVDQMCGFLVNQNPFIRIKPKRPGTGVQAKAQEKEINYCWEEYDYQSQVRKAVLDHVIIGWGVGRDGYNLTVDEPKDPTEGQIYYEDYIKIDAPFFKRISPFLFYYDPDASEHNLETARYAFELIPKHPDDVMANSDYDQKVLKSMHRNRGQGGKTPKTISSVFKESEGRMKWDTIDDNDRDLWLICDLEDKKMKERHVFLLGVDEPLIRNDPWPDYREAFSFNMLSFIPDVNEHFPIGIVKWLEDHNYELDRHVTQLFDYRRQITGGQYYAQDENVVTGTELDRFRAGQRVTVMKATDGIGPIPSPDLPPDIWRVEAEIRQNMRSLSGLDELVRGGNLGDRASATEVNARTNMLTLKIDQRKSEVDRFVTKIAKKTLQHIKANWLGERHVQLTGKLGEYWGRTSNEPPDENGVFWVPYTKQDIQDEADVEVISTAKPRYDPVLDRQQFMTMYTQTLQSLPVIQQSLAQQGQSLDLGKMLRTMFERFEEHDADSYFTLSRVAAAPVQEITELEQGQQMQTPPQMQNTTQMTQQEAAPAQSDIMGQLMGALSGGQQ